MPGYLLAASASVLCMHGGRALPTAPLPRVQLGGQPAVGQAAPWTVAGCPFVPPAAGPCVTAQWVVAATRVVSGGVPLLLQDSVAVCAPTGTGLQVLMTQTRAKGA
jgi:hypothetical protein